MGKAGTSRLGHQGPQRFLLSEDLCGSSLSQKLFSGEVCILLWSRRMQTQMVRQAEVWIHSATGLESQLLTHYATLSKLLNLSEPWLSGL